MTPIQCLQLILTLVVTGACTAVFGIVFRSEIATNKWLMWAGRSLLAFHAIAPPVVMILLIWSI
jgi:hypothetical protein